MDVGIVGRKWVAELVEELLEELVEE